MVGLWAFTSAPLISFYIGFLFKIPLCEGKRVLILSQMMVELLCWSPFTVKAPLLSGIYC